MKPAKLVIAAVVLSLPSPASAQGDPISGTWAGDVGQSLAQRHPITFELKFDGTSAITGTVAGPGSALLKTGSFDPATGMLRLEVEVKDDTTPKVFVFEGFAIAGTITGRVKEGTQTGSFRLAKAVGQATGGGDAAAELKRTFAEVSGQVGKSADLVPVDKYAYKPTATVRSFGQLIGHLADSYNYYCATAAGREVQWSDPIEKGKTDKATLLPKLKQALDGCTSVYNGAGRIAPLLDNVAHTNLHYGNLITYLRMMGLVPPSS